MFCRETRIVFIHIKGDHVLSSVHYENIASGYVTDSEVSAGETRHKLNDRCKLCTCLLNVQ